jgi:hypothetical protein
MTKHSLIFYTALSTTTVNSSNSGAFLCVSGERLHGIQEVIGSIPTVSTQKSRSKERGFFIHCESNGIS